jgi:nucleoid-associated protein YgaU
VDALETLYEGISKATPYGPGILIENAKTVQLIGTAPSLLNVLALEVRPALYWHADLSNARSSLDVPGPAPKPAAKPQGKIDQGTINAYTTCIAPNSDQPTQCSTYYTYTIARGESLSAIAARIYRDPGKWTVLYKWNKAVIGPNPNVIRAGTELVIPTR